jgi:DNA-binding MarR family transcriptional regulator
MQPLFNSTTYEPRAGLGFLLHRVRIALLDDLDRELEPLGITAAQYVVLVRLSKEAVTSSTHLCRDVSYDPGAMTRMIDRLEKKGLVQRVRRADDRRKVDLQLTPEGVAVQPKLIEAAVQVLNRRLHGFTRDEVAQMEAFLRRMLAVAPA